MPFVHPGYSIMLKTAILGSTGSVGTQALEVARAHPGIRVTALTAHRNVRRMEAQIREFSPEFAALEDEDAACELALRIRDTDTKVLAGRQGVTELIARCGAETFVNSVTGFDGLHSTLAVIRQGARLALANKESIVAAGELVLPMAKETGAEILPVDSEHCAIHQCLRCGTHDEVKSLIITASGGPFRGFTQQQLEQVTLEQTLHHPTWSMGRKITVDSATLMNKGFEVIEAAHLFALDADRIRVVVHPESIIHSMVEYIDHAILAQMSVPDMRLCVQYALTFPSRLEGLTAPLDLTAAGSLRFEKPDTECFPLLPLAFRALREGGTHPAVLNAANEIAVGAFLRGELSFRGIAELVLRAYEDTPDFPLTVEGICEADGAARETAERLAESMKK